jgi:sulfite oxidase
VGKNSSKKAKVAAILVKHPFPPPPEFQLAPIPDAIPILEGKRWELWHKTIGGWLTNVPEESSLRMTDEKDLESCGSETYFKRV